MTLNSDEINETFSDIGYAKVDLTRANRQGIPEVIYGEGKTTEQIAGILVELMRAGILEREHILVTRLSREKATELEEHFPLQYMPDAHLAIVGDAPMPECKGNVVIATAGTSDIAVAEEAAFTLTALGNNVKRIYDVGVSGVQRLLAHEQDFAKANAIVVVAGMEGALASVIGGLAKCPIIAVPTSIGYGASFEGITALLSMLNSCSIGVSVVNIDNGFGAGVIASRINLQSIEGGKQ